MWKAARLSTRPPTAARTAAAGFLDRVFDGAADELVQSLLRAEKIPPQELERLHILIAQARRGQKQRKGEKP